MAENSKHSSTGKWFLKNIAGIAAFFLGLAVVTFFALSLITQHGKTITVPDMTNLSVAEASAIAEESGLRIDVIDSAYVRRMAKGAIYRQNPKAGADVKKGRRILLTINATHSKQVSMPNLVGYSMRQAKADLSSRGLMLGKLIYVDDIATNNVLGQQYRGRKIAPGTSIESGSEIDLVVGLEINTGMTLVPNVVGLKYIRATDAIHDNSLNIRRCVFDKNITNYSDSLDAVVTRQSPEASDAPILMGADVTLYLSKGGPADDK